jgi:hypothetical protein
LSGDDIDLRTYSSALPEPTSIRAPGWLFDEVQDAVDEITRQIRDDVHLDPDINYMTYPVPSDLLTAARDDLISKIEKNESRYINKKRYWNGLYNSASAKVISVIREWYVDEVKHRINEMYTKGAEQINEEIKKNFTEPEKVKQANRDAVNFLSGGMNLPLGLTMTAYRVDENGNAYPYGDIRGWKEAVTLSINQEPNYLFMDADEPNKELITLGVRNINIFGPTGLPVLPSMNPWLAHTNAWRIEVQGKINRFEVHDIDNEVHPNPVFGHEAQVYVRELETVFDPVSGFSIGDNEPVKFSFTTGTFILVPSGKTIGDKEGGFKEESPYFGKIL